MFNLKCSFLKFSGDEWEGVSGVRDSKGNFHRWHDEIHLEPEGTEERTQIKILKIYKIIKIYKNEMFFFRIVTSIFLENQL